MTESWSELLSILFALVLNRPWLEPPTGVAWKSLSALAYLVGEANSIFEVETVLVENTAFRESGRILGTDLPYLADIIYARGFIGVRLWFTSTSKLFDALSVFLTLKPRLLIGCSAKAGCEVLLIYYDVAPNIFILLLSFGRSGFEFAKSWELDPDPTCSFGWNIYLFCMAAVLLWDLRRVCQV